MRRIVSCLVFVIGIFLPSALYASPDCEYNPGLFPCVYRTPNAPVMELATIGIVVLVPTLFFFYIRKKQGRGLVVRAALFVVVYTVLLWYSWQFLFALSRVYYGA